MTVIAASNIKKTYPTKPPVEALKGLSLEVKESKCVALLGPNGVGKTTFLRILTGILLPDDGSITVYDKNPLNSSAEVSSLLRFLPETPFLLQNNSLWENGYFWFSYWNEPFPKDNLKEILERFNLINRAKEPLSRYSRGMIQKAALSIMLATRAPVIILDEPTLGLDVTTKREVIEMIIDLKKKEKTIIVASHDMPFVEKIADHIALINNGKIVEMTEISDFKERHGNLRYLLTYRKNGKLYKEIFHENTECNFRLRNILSDNDIEIVEVHQECDSLEEILNRLLIDGR